jgi:hypothetical protein
VLHTDDGDFWSFEDGKRSRALGLTATAGLSFPQFRPEGLRYSETGPVRSSPRPASGISTPTASGRRCCTRR